VSEAATLLHVRHDTTYRYGARVEVAYHIAHLLVRDTPRQKVLDARLAIVPHVDDEGTQRDFHGNQRTLFSLFAPHDELHVRAEARVAVAPLAPLDAQDSPPWDEVAAAMRYTARAPMPEAAPFCLASPFVSLHEPIGKFARESFTPGRPLLEAAIELSSRIFREFKYVSGSTEIHTPVLQSFEQRRGVCQDFAHVMLAALRTLGLPARYVSGYLLTQPPPGQPRRIGADASHAWVSLWCPKHGWVDLDPTNDVIVDREHVTLAIGRDFGDVTPLRGVIRGGGQHVLEVAVTVTPEGG
jgi:transglutaminase-like putative cysteine protease